MALTNKKIAETVRKEAKKAAAVDEVMTEYLSSLPEYRDKIDRLREQGLNPMAWFNVADAHSAFSVDCEKPSDVLLAEVFKQCDLDPKKPRHWRILVDTLVSQCFRSAGAPQKWTGERLFDLYCDVRELQSRYPTVKEHGQLAKLLRSKKPHREKYEKAFDAQTLRKLVGRALNPELNPTAAIPDDDDFIAARAEHYARRLALPTELGIAAQIKMLEKDAFAQARAIFEKYGEAAGGKLNEADWEACLPHIQQLVDNRVKLLRGGRTDE